MAEPISVQELGNQLMLIFDDGGRRVAYPTVGGLWHVSSPTPDNPTDPGGDPPVPGDGGLTDWWSPIATNFFDWEDHWTYSRGGTDWTMPEGTPLKAPAPGVLVNYGNTDGAGLKSILVFDVQHQRLIPASNTLMNGVYRETQGGDWAFGMAFQHLSSQNPGGHYNQGDVIVISGNTGDSTGPHLHGHLLAHPTTVGANRLDFMKFTN